MKKLPKPNPGQHRFKPTIRWCFKGAPNITADRHERIPQSQWRSFPRVSTSKQHHLSSSRPHPHDCTCLLRGRRTTNSQLVDREKGVATLLKYESTTKPWVNVDVATVARICQYLYGFTFESINSLQLQQV